MSYIKIEFGGKERGFKFNQLALEIIRSKSNPQSDIQNVYALFYGGLRGNSFAKEEEFEDYFGEVDSKGNPIKTPITFEMITDWVDELYLKPEAGEVIKSVSDVFTNTQMYQSIIASTEKPSENGEKKRRLKKSS